LKVIETQLLSDHMVQLLLELHKLCMSRKRRTEQLFSLYVLIFGSNVVRAVETTCLMNRTNHSNPTASTTYPNQQQSIHGLETLPGQLLARQF
jgi:hypothetical protein